MQATLDRLEQLFAERTALTERFAELWAIHGGGSDTWEDHLVDIETAPVKAAIRERLTAGGNAPKESELKEALHLAPEYQQRVRAAVRGRVEWAVVREHLTTLTWRIQLEMAKLRLGLGDEATPTDTERDARDE